MIWSLSAMSDSEFWAHGCQHNAGKARPTSEIDQLGGSGNRAVVEQLGRIGDVPDPDDIHAAGCHHLPIRAEGHAHRAVPVSGPAGPAPAGAVLQPPVPAGPSPARRPRTGLVVAGVDAEVLEAGGCVGHGGAG